VSLSLAPSAIVEGAAERIDLGAQIMGGDGRGYPRRPEPDDDDIRFRIPSLRHRRFVVHGPFLLAELVRDRRRDSGVDAVAVSDFNRVSKIHYGWKAEIMLTIDVQVHAYERNHPGRPWLGTLRGPAEMTGDQMVKAMDAVGVDGAVLVSPFSMYGYDAGYAREVHAAHPGRFGLVKPVDPNDPAVADTIADWAATDGTVGIRIMMRDNVSTDPADPGINRALAAAAQHSLPVNLMCWGRLEQAAQLAAQNPNTKLVIDHLGLQQPFEPPAPAEPWADLPKVLALAAHDNIAIKISGACTLSHEPFPYKDIWDPLGRIFDAFGFDRCMWGTDWTRAVGLLTYQQGVEAFRVTDRLSDGDRAALMGETLTRVYGWSPSRA
jgi:L-fuconolactonase